MKNFFLAIALFILTQPLLASEPNLKVGAFQESTNANLLLCRLQEKIASNKIELGQASDMSSVTQCIVHAKSEVKNLFPPALKSISKNAAASKLLKDYYASWITSINGVMPSPGVTNGQYAQQQEAADAKNEENWNRFEVEAGL